MLIDLMMSDYMVEHKAVQQLDLQAISDLEVDKHVDKSRVRVSGGDKNKRSHFAIAWNDRNVDK